MPHWWNISVGHFLEESLIDDHLGVFRLFGAALRLVIMICRPRTQVIISEERRPCNRRLTGVVVTVALITIELILDYCNSDLALLVDVQVEVESLKQLLPIFQLSPT